MVGSRRLIAAYCPPTMCLPVAVHELPTLGRKLLIAYDWPATLGGLMLAAHCRPLAPPLGRSLRAPSTTQRLLLTAYHWPPTTDRLLLTAYFSPPTSGRPRLAA